VRGARLPARSSSSARRRRERPRAGLGRGGGARSGAIGGAIERKTRRCCGATAGALASGLRAPRAPRPAARVHTTLWRRRRAPASATGATVGVVRAFLRGGGTAAPERCRDTRSAQRRAAARRARGRRSVVRQTATELGTRRGCRVCRTQRGRRGGGCSYARSRRSARRPKTRCPRQQIVLRARWIRPRANIRANMHAMR
jgi:hypothetical protein